MKIGANYRRESGCEFVVWAPFASSVQIKIVSPEKCIIQMDKDSKGYWKKW